MWLKVQFAKGAREMHEVLALENGYTMVKRGGGCKQNTTLEVEDEKWIQCSKVKGQLRHKIAFFN